MSECTPPGRQPQPRRCWDNRRPFTADLYQRVHRCPSCLLLLVWVVRLDRYGRPVSQAELADLTGLSRRTVGVHLQHLEARRLIYREGPPGRAQRLTPAADYSQPDRQGVTAWVPEDHPKLTPAEFAKHFEIAANADWQGRVRVEAGRRVERSRAWYGLQAKRCLTSERQPRWTADLLQGRLPGLSTGRSTGGENSGGGVRRFAEKPVAHATWSKEGDLLKGALRVDDGSPVAESRSVERRTVNPSRSVADLDRVDGRVRREWWQMRDHEAGGMRSGWAGPGLRRVLQAASLTSPQAAVAAALEVAHRVRHPGRPAPRSRAGLMFHLSKVYQQDPAEELDHFAQRRDEQIEALR